MDIDHLVQQRAAQDVAAWQAAAERWRHHALRTDSLGATARRMHLHCLANAWSAQTLLAQATHLGQEN